MPSQAHKKTTVPAPQAKPVKVVPTPEAAAETLAKEIRHFFAHPYQINLVGRERLMGTALSRAFHAWYFGADHFLKIRIFNAMFSAMGNPRFVMPYTAGWISLDIHDLLQREILRDGHYEKEVFETLVSYARQNEVLWDIGAHVGTFSVRAALNGRFDRVECFEPNPRVHRSLAVNLALNQVPATAHTVALWNKVGKQTLHLAPSANLGLSTLTDTSVIPNAPTREVETTTIDTLIATKVCPAPTLMKIDVEGAELQVLQGALHLLQNNPPKAIIFEAPCDEQLHFTEPEILRLLSSMGMTVKHIPRAGGDIQGRENFVAYTSPEPE
jgi:FkbM family methyltransferase